MNIKLLNDYLLVEEKKHDESSESKSGSLHVPVSSGNRLALATVIKAGPGRYENGTLIVMTVRPGDVIAYNKMAQMEKIVHEGRELFIMREINVTGIMETEIVGGMKTTNERRAAEGLPPVLGIL